MFVFLGFGLVASRPPVRSPTLSVPDNIPTILDGCVVDPALIAADREKFTVELAPDARSQVSLFAKLGESFPRLDYGTQVEFTGKVRTPHNYNNPGSFDNTHYLARQKIYWTASADVGALNKLPGSCGNWRDRFIFIIRTASLDRLDSLYANDTYANGMMQAVLIGATADDYVGLELDAHAAQVVHLALHDRFGQAKLRECRKPARRPAHAAPQRRARDGPSGSSLRRR